MNDALSGRTPAPSDVEAVIVHYRTPDLLLDAARSFRQYEPLVPLRVVDNGSDDPNSVAALAALEREGVAVERLGANRFHGPAMDHALRTSTARAVFFLDSDTRTHRGGFLAPMQARLHADAVAVGEVAYADARGFACAATAPGAVPVPVSAYMLVDRARYAALPPFVHHGLPVLAAMAGAQAQGWTVEAFPVSDYVEHLGRGTAERFGYGLGWRSRLDYLLHRLERLRRR